MRFVQLYSQPESKSDCIFSADVNIKNTTSHRHHNDMTRVKLYLYFLCFMNQDSLICARYVDIVWGVLVIIAHLLSENRMDCFQTKKGTREMENSFISLTFMAIYGLDFLKKFNW